MDFDVPKMENICSLQKHIMAIEELEEFSLCKSCSHQTLIGLYHPFLNFTG